MGMPTGTNPSPLVGEGGALIGARRVRGTCKVSAQVSRPPRTQLKWLQR